VCLELGGHGLDVLNVKSEEDKPCRHEANDCLGLDLTMEVGAVDWDKGTGDSQLD